MIGRREFMTKTFKAIVGGTLILPIPKVLYSFPIDIALPEWYHVSAHDYIDRKHFATAWVKIPPDKLNRADEMLEVVKLLRRVGIYDKYDSWHFIRTSNLPGTEKGFIWSKTFGFDFARVDDSPGFEPANDLDTIVPIGYEGGKLDLIEPISKMTMNLSYDVKKESTSLLVDEVAIYS